MSYNREQFTDLIQRTLRRMDPSMADPVAVKLMLGVCAAESDFGTYLRQIGNGPGRGPFSMEPPTHKWLAEKYRHRFCDEWTWVSLVFAAQEWDLVSAIAFARLRFWVNPSPLPDDNVEAMGNYWKRIYNTDAGAGTIAAFIEKYQKYVEGP